ncbi:hypothetical protein GRI39_04700 [Altererythrobacter indicus]|uniref:Uncharacterized protein n=1 Tax=Altericroceibacterium indicum TaxID=374177 RepID=A0A845A971_9SPHN|nr:hypothetical protein [Altericroceibacterium indicum]MXP25345.1 hypothetical protein [Altericroceibacterium indicum]
MISAWSAPTGEAEMVAYFDHQRLHRLLILPALFDEANKMRHQTLAVMRHLDHRQIDSFLPDLPGCNESLVPLEEQSLSLWIDAAKAAAQSFQATHVLAIRGGALLTPPGLPGWRYAPVSGKSILRQLIRSRTISSTEAGRREKSASLFEQGRKEGIELAGFSLGPSMIAELEESEIPLSPRWRDIEQASLNGPPLWLRAEPDFAADQAERLADIIAQGLKV